MRKLIPILATIIAALGIACPAEAANRFWNPYAVTGAVSGTGGVCRLTISPAIVGGGLNASDTVNVTSVGGATGCNVSTTISTVVDTTHIELTGTTFGGAYTSGGCVAGGRWSAANTANWASTSTATCGSGGLSVPVSGDIVALDTNSLGSIVYADSGSTINLGSLAISNFAGTFDTTNLTAINFSLGNGFANSSSVTRTFIMGGTWTMNNSAVWSMTTTTGLTFSFVGGTTVTFHSTTAAGVTIGLGSSAQVNPFPPITLVSPTSGGCYNFGSNATITGITLPSPNCISFQNAITTIVTNGFTVSGSSASNTIYVGSNSPGAGTTVSSGSANSTFDYAGFRDVTFSGASTWTATNSMNLGHVSGITITAPPTGGANIIGG